MTDCPRCGSVMLESYSSFLMDGFTKEEQKEIKNKSIHDYCCGKCEKEEFTRYFLLLHDKWYVYDCGWKFFSNKVSKEKVEFT